MFEKIFSAELKCNFVCKIIAAFLFILQLNFICDAASPKILVICPSASENTRIIEKQIKTKLGINNVQNESNSIKDYKVIVIGTQVIQKKADPSVISYLSQNSFSGKKVFLFSTYETDLGSAIEDMKSACSGASFGVPLKIKFKHSGNKKKKINFPYKKLIKWIRKIEKTAK